MTIYEVCKEIETIIKPFRYRYEHDNQSKMYYFTLFKSDLRTIYFTLAERTIKTQDKEVKNRIKNIKERYLKR